ncbi:response regulator transcription factor [Phenylobacterium sp.]|jgi:DNA-binding NarL/FixJ family response regulator|uniref:response regulator transcription factor n=1 Tax=Phenylobacterium sp. TaxID=1871053 RepID=UPI0025E8BC59|nr:response regulator transcription factor [Phenylobacterium sp.]MCA3722018.1 response regulator transcription factor [Phenylobacterium sp.]
MAIRTAVIEDDPAVLAQLTRLIDASGDVEVSHTARNYAEGVKLVRAGGYDVLMCDLGLPDGSGIDLIRSSVSLHPAADVIVVTMFADHKKVLDSIKAGAKGYLLKDENLEDCVQGIREIRRGGSPINPFIARKLLERFRPDTSDAQQEVLSERETEVLGLLARGYSYGEIATLLGISAQTVGTYVKRLYRKLEVGSRSEAVFEASSRGLLNGL